MEKLRELALFAGAGGGILGGKLLGWRTVCAVECAAYAAQVLAQRQNDGILEPFPIWSDVCSFDGKPWRGVVDIISGGFPCTDISVAGRGAGIDGKKSGLWREMARVIDEVRPRFVFVENSPALIRRGLARVISDLAKMGYDAKWGIIGADDVGAPHIRKRIWILAYSGIQGRWKIPGSSHVANAKIGKGRKQKAGDRWEGFNPSSERNSDCRWWDADPANEAQPRVDRMVDGVDYGVDRLAAIGNGQIPAVAAIAYEILSMI